MSEGGNPYAPAVSAFRRLAGRLAEDAGAIGAEAKLRVKGVGNVAHDSGSAHSVTDGEIRATLDRAASANVRTAPAASARGSFDRLPEPVSVQLHGSIWRSKEGKVLGLTREQLHANKSANGRALLRRHGISDDIAHPPRPGTPEFDRMMEAASSDSFIYVLRGEDDLAIYPERTSTGRMEHEALIVNVQDTVAAAGEVRISGRAGVYEVSDLNNRSGGFEPPPGTLSGAALPAFERRGLFPQQISVWKDGWTQETHIRGE